MSSSSPLNKIIASGTADSMDALHESLVAATLAKEWEAVDAHMSLLPWSSHSEVGRFAPELRATFMLLYEERDAYRIFVLAERMGDAVPHWAACLKDVLRPVAAATAPVASSTTNMLHLVSSPAADGEDLPLAALDMIARKKISDRNIRAVKQAVDACFVIDMSLDKSDALSVKAIHARYVKYLEEHKTSSPLVESSFRKCMRALYQTVWCVNDKRKQAYRMLYKNSDDAEEADASNDDDDDDDDDANKDEDDDDDDEEDDDDDDEELSDDFIVDDMPKRRRIKKRSMFIDEEAAALFD